MTTPIAKHHHHRSPNHHHRRPAPARRHLDMDPLGGEPFVLLAVTGLGGVRVEVRLFVGREERGDWARAMGMLLHDARSGQMARAGGIRDMKTADEPATEADLDLLQPEGCRRCG